MMVGMKHSSTHGKDRVEYLYIKVGLNLGGKYPIIGEAGGVKKYRDNEDKTCAR